MTGRTTTSPGHHGRHGEGGLVGREEEFGELCGMLGSVHDRGDAVCISGEPGVGKSALMRAVGERSLLDGLRVLQATGVEAESGFAYASLERLLEPLTGPAHGATDRSSDVLRAAFARDRVREPDEVYLVAMAVLDLVTSVADDLPTVILVDDVQWADSPSAEVLGFVGRRIAHDPIVLVTAGRRDDRRWHDALREFVLEPLGEQSAIELLAATSPDLSTPLTARVLELAAGNPLGLIELGRTLAVLDETALGLDRQIPLTARLEAAFASGTKSLGETARALLLAAALAPGASWSEITAAVTSATGIRPDAGALGDLDDLGLLTSDRRSVRFRHPLARSAVVQAASQRERQSLHEGLARAIREPERNLRHRSSAAVGFDDELADELDLRSRHRSGRAALDTLERAAELTQDPVERSRRLLRCAELADGLAERSEVMRYLDAVEVLEPTGIDRVRTTALRIVSDDVAPSDPRPSLELLALAHEASGVGEIELTLQFLTKIADRSRSARLVDELQQQVVELALGVPVEANDLRVTNIIAHVAPIGRSATIIERLIGVEPGGMASDHDHLLAYSAMAVGDMPLAAVAFDSAIARERTARQLRPLAVDLSMRGWVALELGDWGTAGQFAGEALTLAMETGQHVLACPALLLQAVLAGAIGDTEQENRQIAEASQLINRGGVANYRLAINLARGMAAAVDGRHGDAVSALDVLLDSDEPDHNPRHAVPAIAYYAHSAARAGRADHARRVLRRFEEQNPGGSGPGMRIAFTHAACALAPESGAVEAYEAALADVMMQRAFDQARLRLGLGSWLRQRRHIVESRVHLRLAAQLFDVMGNVPFANRARAGLRAAGERTGHTAPNTRSELTPQEAQIADLAAAGLSNKQIGERLFLSHRTVASHLYRIFPKLGITARSQISPALATDRRPLDGR